MNSPGIFVISARPGFDLKCLLVHRWSCFVREVTLRNDVALHMLHSMCIWSPYSTSSPLLEGQWGLTVCQRVRRTRGSSSDKITKQKHLLLHSSVPNSVWGKETNLKQLLFSPCVFKTQRQKCPSDFKGTRPDFDKNWTRRTRTESITVEHTCDLQPPSRSTVWGRLGLAGNLLGLPLGDLQEWLYWDHCIVEGLTEERCRASQSFPTILSIFLLALLWEIPSPVLLSLLHLLHSILSCSFSLPPVVPKLPYSSTRDSRLFLLPFRFRRSLLPINYLLTFV